MNRFIRFFLRSVACTVLWTILWALTTFYTSTTALAYYRLIRGITVPSSSGDAVSDGDTIRVQPDDWNGRSDSILRIRMIGIDAPELHLPVHGEIASQDPWGQYAANYLASLLPPFSHVIVEIHGTDKYGRTLARIYAGPNATDVNYLMVRSGWAVPYIYCTGPSCVPGYFEHENVWSYLQACDAARSEGRGVFNPINPIPEMPYQFRLRMQNRQPDKYVGDFVTRRLYHPNDHRQVDDCRRIFFSDISQALAMGFSYY